MAIAFVQSKSAATASSGAARTLAFDSNITAGNTLLAFVGVFSNAISPPVVTDSQGNRWEAVTWFPMNSAASVVWVFFCRNAKTTGACTVTCTPSAAMQVSWSVLEYSGVAHISPVESFTSNNQIFVTSGSTGPVPVPRAGETIVCGVGYLAFTGAATAGSGYTQRAVGTAAGDWSIFVEDKIGVSADTSATVTFATTTSYGAVAICLRPTVTPTSTIQAVPGQANGNQYVSPTNSSWVTDPLDVTFPAATTTGNLLVCVVGIDGGGGGALTTTVTDNKSNTWTLLTSHGASSGAGSRVELWYCANATGGSNHTVTVTPDDAVYLAAVVNEYTGTSGIFSLLTDNGGVSTTPSTGNFHTTAQMFSIAGMVTPDTPGSSTATQNAVKTPTGWNLVYSLPGESQYSVGLNVVSFGEITDDPGTDLNAIWTFTNSNFWAVTAAAVTPEGSGGGNANCMGEDSMLLEKGRAFTREFALGETGLDVNIQLSKNGGALDDPAAGPSTLDEVGRGLYKFALDADDVDTEGSLGYALTDDATNTTIYGHVVDRVWEITKDIMTNPNTDNFTVPNTFGATFTQGGVIALNTDLTPLPNMTEPTAPPNLDDPLIDGISWICHLCVTKRDETEDIQHVYNIAGDTVIAHSDQSDNGTVYVHSKYSG